MRRDLFDVSSQKRLFNNNKVNFWLIGVNTLSLKINGQLNLIIFKLNLKLFSEIINHREKHIKILLYLLYSLILLKCQ